MCQLCIRSIKKHLYGIYSYRNVAKSRVFGGDIGGGGGGRDLRGKKIPGFSGLIGKGKQSGTSMVSRLQI